MKLVRTYSRYWRVNRSRHEATELALAIRALRKLAGHLGRNVKPVAWAGMAEDDGRTILLDPAPLMGTYPIPHGRFDVLAGRVIREGLASLEWTEWVLGRAAAALAGLPSLHKAFLMALAYAFEHLFIRFLEKKPVFDRYLDRYLEGLLAGETRDPGLPPSPGSLAAAWLSLTMGKGVDERSHPDTVDVLAALDGAAGELRWIAGEPVPGRRREARAEFYVRALRGLYDEVISRWDIFEPGDEEDAVNLRDEAAPPGELPEPEEGEEEEKGESEAAETGGLSPELAEEVERILEEGDQDLSRQVSLAVADPEARAMPTRFRKGRALSSVRPDPLTVARLRRIFARREDALARARRRRFVRGLSEGQVDARRLFRVGLDGRVFRARENPGDDERLSLSIVADASASMSGKGVEKPWQAAERVFVSLAEAARGFEAELSILGYCEEEKICTLTELYSGGRFYTLVPAGRTPSGQAILAAASRLGSRGPGRSILVHVTDGASNCGLPLSEARDFCRKRGIEMYTVGIGMNPQTRDFLLASLPEGSVFFMKDVRFLAEGLERLFRKTLL